MSGLRTGWPDQTASQDEQEAKAGELRFGGSQSSMRVPDAGYVLLPIEIGEASPRPLRTALECSRTGSAAEHGMPPESVGEPPYEGVDRWELRLLGWGCKTVLDAALLEARRGL